MTSIILDGSHMLIRGLEKTIGLQPLDDSHLVTEDIPATLATDPNTCPLAYTGCLGAKDPEFEGRCSGRNLPYLNCQVYILAEKLEA